MSVPVFNADQHHVGLGPSGGIVYGFQLFPGYRKRGQNAGVSNQDFGGERDLLAAPSQSRWTQDDYTGGAFFETWGSDEAGFSSCRNMVPWQHSRSLRTVPPLIPAWLADHSGRDPMYAFGYEDRLYACFENNAYGTRITDGNVVFTGLADPDTVFTAFAEDNAHAILYMGTRADPFGVITNSLSRVTLPNLGNPGVPSLAYPTDVPSNNDQGRIGGLFPHNKDLLVLFASTLWALTVPRGDVAAADKDWRKIGRVPGPWVGAVGYQGFSYILFGGGSVRRAQVSAFDGDSLLPVAEFPYTFTPGGITSYAGRIYVYGVGMDPSSGNYKYAELYEVTGQSLRLIRSFAPESFTSGANFPDTIYHASVFDGMLYFGFTGQGLMAYDIVNDALYGANQLLQSNPDANFRFIQPLGSDLYTYVEDVDASASDGWYKMAKPGDSMPVGYNADITTSDFSPEPGRLKRWSELAVQSRDGYASAEYSTDSGATWTSLTQTDGNTRGTAYYAYFSLAAVPPTEQIRFRLTMQRGTNVSYGGEIIAHTCSFVFLDSGKWAWTFVINGSPWMEDAASYDATDPEPPMAPDTPIQDTVAVHELLASWWRDRARLTFRDLDGNDYDVQMTDFEEGVATILPQHDYVSDAGAVSGRDARYSISLIEV